MSEVKHFDIDGTIIDIPVGTTVNNGTLTIQKNGSNVASFSANQSGDTTANITVPTKVSELTNDSGYTTNTGTVTQVKVGSTAYNPSSGVVSLPAYPSVPTVNNGTLTIQKNGTNVATFTANQSGNATANITVPTKVSELTNDSGYTTNTGTVTQVKVGSTAYNPSSGVVSLPAYPTVNNATLTIQKNGTNVATFTANQSSNATANITVPTVNNGTLTIQKNGTNVATFTANQSGNATANITVPTKTSDLTYNDTWVEYASHNGTSGDMTFANLNSKSYHDILAVSFFTMNSANVTLTIPMIINLLPNGTYRVGRTGFYISGSDYATFQATLSSTTASYFVAGSSTITNASFKLYVKR